MNKKRIALTLFLALLSEVANKLVPLITLHFVATRLGTAAFGSAQFALWLLDWGIFFTVYGFAQVAPIMLRNAKDPEEQKQINGSVVLTRLMLATVATAALFYAVRNDSNFAPYQAAVLSSIGILFTSAIDSAWILMARQRMAFWSVLTIVSKLASLIAILLFIQSPEDAVKFVLITNVANASISVASFAIAIKLVGISWPRAGQVSYAFKLSTPFAISALFLMTLERFDLYLIEEKLGASATGIYASATKLVASLTPIILTITSIFYSEMMAHQDKDAIQRHLRASIFWAVSAFGPAVVGVWFVDSEALRLIFGPDYMSGNRALSLLVMGAIFYGMIVVFGFQLLALKSLWRPLVAGLGLGVAVGVSFGISVIDQYGINGVAWAATLARVAAGTVIAFIAIRVWQLHLYSLVSTALRAFSPSILMGITILIGRQSQMIPVEIFPTLAVGAVSYLLAFSTINASELRAATSKALQIVRKRISPKSP